MVPAGTPMGLAICCVRLGGGGGGGSLPLRTVIVCVVYGIKHAVFPSMGQM